MSQIRTERLENGNIRVTIPIVFKQTANGRRIEAVDEPQENDNRQAMLMAIARGRRWQKLIDDGEVDSVTELARIIGRNESYVAGVIRLACLAPDIVHSIIEGNYPLQLSLCAMRGCFPIVWEEQRKRFIESRRK